MDELHRWLFWCPQMILVPWQNLVKFLSNIVLHKPVQRDIICLLRNLFSLESRLSLIYCHTKHLVNSQYRRFLASSYLLLHSIYTMNIDLSFIGLDNTSSLVSSLLNTKICSPGWWISKPKMYHKASLAYTYLQL